MTDDGNWNIEEIEQAFSAAMAERGYGDHHIPANGGWCRFAFVSKATAERVANFLHRFLFPHAVAFYTNIFGLADEHDRLAAVAGYILARELNIITTRDVQRGDGTMRKLKRRDIEDVFSQLDALGWITRSPGLRANDPPRGIVNPEVHVLFAERARDEEERRRRAREELAAALSSSKP